MGGLQNQNSYRENGGVSPRCLHVSDPSANNDKKEKKRDESIFDGKFIVTTASPG